MWSGILVERCNNLLCVTSAVGQRNYTSTNQTEEYCALFDLLREKNRKIIFEEGFCLYFCIACGIQLIQFQNRFNRISTKTIAIASVTKCSYSSRLLKMLQETTSYCIKVTLQNGK